MGERMERREFLRRGLVAASALPLAGGEVWAQGRMKGAGRKKVIVVGAGLAGLAAAFELGRAGHSVTVLEARTRAGGRVRTVREPFSDGLYAEAGAQYVPEGHALTMRYARMFGLRLAPVMADRRPTVYAVRGEQLVGGAGRWPLELTEEERRGGPDGLMEKYVLPALKELGGDVSADDWPPPELRKYDRVSMADFLRGRGASAGALAVFDLGYLGINGDGIESYSALTGLRDLLLGHGGREYKVVGGTDLLPRAFARRLADRIQYGAPVVRIEQTAEGVSAVYLKAGLKAKITGDRLICTAPFTVLRGVEVAPRFSAEKERAIEELPMTSVVRTYLQVRRKVWLDRGVSGEVISDEPRAWFAPLGHRGPRDILEAFATGEAAQRAGRLDEAGRVAAVLDASQRFFPSVKAEFEGGASVDWDADEWARGAWTWYRPGQLEALGPHLARPEGRVHFAGEHTSAWPGWMQGALASGLRAAREVAEAEDR